MEAKYDQGGALFSRTFKISFCNVNFFKKAKQYKAMN